MANQPESPTYDAGVYQLETTDPVQGGLGGIANAPLLNLADRTAYLKQHVDTLEANLSGYALLNSPTFTGTPLAPTPPTGDNTTKIATTAFVQTTVGGVATVSVAGNANVTLNQSQYGCGNIVLTGALTGSINVIFPAQGKWLVQNNTTGAFQITAKTAAGTGVQLPQGFARSIGTDGTNILGDNSADKYVIAGSTSGLITIKGAPVAGTYNFNLPITAGATGAPLVSGGGGSGAMTWGTQTGTGNFVMSAAPTLTGVVTIGSGGTLNVSGPSISLNTAFAVPFIITVSQTPSIGNGGVSAILTMGSNNQVQTVTAMFGANAVRSEVYYNGSSITFLNKVTSGVGIDLVDGGGGVLQIKNTTGGTITQATYTIK